MHNVLIGIHISACLFLILMVLLQAGRGAGFALFGGGGDTLFASPGGSGALKKATMIFATTFAITSLMLTLISSRPGLSSVTGKALSIPAPQGQAQQANTTTPGVGKIDESAQKKDADAPLGLPEEKN